MQFLTSLRDRFMGGTGAGQVCVCSERTHTQAARGDVPEFVKGACFMSASLQSQA